jgi:SET domain-containing protein
MIHLKLNEITSNFYYLEKETKETYKNNIILDETENIEIKPSIIKNAGRGVFAKRNISKGKILGKYTGKKHFSKNDEIKNDSSFANNKYLFLISQTDSGLLFIDGSDGGNWTCMINGAKTPTEKKKINIEAFLVEEDIYLKTTRIIKKGDELLFDYGPYYWN